MARKPIIAGNWKMHMLRAEATELASALVTSVGQRHDVDVVLCPTFTALGAVADAIKGSRIGLGAQNCHFEEKGAFTGEISVPMLKDAGCQYVIVGHSERRQYFGETDAGINRKAQAIYKHGLTPIICVGETLDQREGGKMEEVVSTQVRGCLDGLEAEKVAASVIAYEPVWAIGTGKTATEQDVATIHAMIRRALVERYGDAGAKIAILYGGSVKAANAASLLAVAEVGGALVGGASLKAEEFLSIARAAR